MDGVPAKGRFLPAARLAALVAVFALALLPCRGGPASPPPDRPSFIWITVDALRADNLGCYGYARDTSPNIDAFAEGGVLLENTFSQSTFTAYSVPSYMTGRYFPVMCLGWMFSAATQWVTPPREECLFPEIMRDNGYATAMFSANPLFSRGDRLWKAFHEARSLEMEGGTFMAQFDRVNEQVVPWLEKNATRPFFLYLHIMDVHFPIFPKPPHDRWVDPQYDKGALVATDYAMSYERKDGKPFTMEDRFFFSGLYDAGVAHADEHFGVLLAHLERLGLRKNTYILLSSDHGQVLGEDGRTVEHEGSLDIALHVPFILSGPGLPAGAQFRELAENVDIVPTMIDLLQLQTQAKTDGRSLAPLVRGEQGYSPRTRVFSVPERVMYERPSIMILRGEDRKYEYHPTDGTIRLWRLPEIPDARVDLSAEEAESVESFGSALRGQYLPLWDAFSALPVRAVVLDAGAIASLAELQSPGVVEKTLSPELLLWKYREDGKWAYSGGLFWACGLSEKAPPVSGKLAVRPGKYQVFASLLNRQDHEGGAASFMKILLTGDSEPRSARTGDLSPDSPPRFELVDLGACDLGTGEFSFTISLGGEANAVFLSRLVLVPLPLNQVSEEETRLLVQKTLRELGAEDEAKGSVFESETPEERQEKMDILKTLGYL